MSRSHELDPSGARGHGAVLRPQLPRLAYRLSSVTKSGHTAKWSNAVASAGQSCRNAAFRSRTPDESMSGIGATRQTSITA
jgi:hypothetical protein